MKLQGLKWNELKKTSVVLYCLKSELFKDIKICFYQVELRAFCSKHSESRDFRSSRQSQDPFEAVNSGSYVVNHLPVTLSINRPQKLAGRRNSDNLLLCKEASDTNSEKLDDGELEDIGSTAPSLNADCVDTHKSTVQGVEDANPLDSLKFASIMKKASLQISFSFLKEFLLSGIAYLNYNPTFLQLIDQGKVNVKDVASEIGIPPDSLCAKLTVMAVIIIIIMILLLFLYLFPYNKIIVCLQWSSILQADNLVPDLKFKIVRWLRNHAYIGTLQKNLRVKLKSAVLSKAVVGSVDRSDSLSVPDSDNSDLMVENFVTTRRKTKSNISHLKNDEVKSTREETLGGHGIVMQSGALNQQPCEEQSDSHKDCIQDAGEKVSTLSLFFFLPFFLVTTFYLSYGIHMMSRQL